MSKEKKWSDFDLEEGSYYITALGAFSAALILSSL